MFTAANLIRLQPGQLPVANNTGNAKDPPNKIISRAPFDALDCGEFG